MAHSSHVMEEEEDIAQSGSIEPEDEELDVFGSDKENEQDSSRKKGKRRRRGGVEAEFFKPRPRGAEGGPMRTPQHIADAWQAEESYEVEKVRMNHAKFEGPAIDMTLLCFFLDRGKQDSEGRGVLQGQVDRYFVTRLYMGATRTSTGRCS